MSEPPLRIRNFRAGDLETLYQIDRICFPEDIAFSRTELAFYLNHSQSIARVANEPGRILGFVLAHIENSSYAHVLTLDVVPEARRRKIGTALMETLHSKLKMKGIGAAILEVGIGNIPAQRLYERLHYQYLATLRGYYHGKDDAYRMARVVCSGSGGFEINTGAGR
jgi:ribosomal-protein-alanine N-acetyltransferase